MDYETLQESGERVAKEFGDEIAARAAAVFVDFQAALEAGVSVSAALEAAQAAFTGWYARGLAEAFNSILRVNIDAQAVLNMPVGPVKLSEKLYANNQQVQAEVTTIVQRHANGIHQARELALALYDGYNRDNKETRPLEFTAQGKLPYPLSMLIQEPSFKDSLLPLLEQARKQAEAIKTPMLRATYLDLIDAWEKGAAKKVLDNKIKSATAEKNRYFANRIAQTELAYALGDKVASEMMGDEDLAVVQFKLNPKHPRSDICDLFAKGDFFGLGPGLYPKEKAPVYPLHPFCWCRLKSVYSRSAFGAAYREEAASEYLRGLDMGEAGAVMGSMLKAGEVMTGARTHLEIYNAGRPDGYGLRMIGDVAN
ncbi:MAG: hypothetical protein ACKO0Z_22150 [Betaproteobacteria bacterium]